MMPFRSVPSGRAFLVGQAYEPTSFAVLQIPKDGRPMTCLPQTRTPAEGTWFNLHRCTHRLVRRKAKTKVARPHALFRPMYSHGPTG